MHASNWDCAIDHFLEYLPDKVSSWIVLLELPAHQQIAKSLIPRLELSELFVLGETDPIRVLEAGREHALIEDCGVIEFIIKDGTSRYRGQDYHDALLEFSYWPCHRVKLCLDIWDDNFSLLFAEAPHVLEKRCYAMSERLMVESLLECENEDAARTPMLLDCTGAAWTTYSGFEEFDYILPTGEIACLPQSVNGVIALQGWIVGTIPFGLKYGRIHHGDLILHFKDRQVFKVTGNHRRLCADFETALLKLPGLRYVAEVGVGQSLAVTQAVRYQTTGCLWHERYFGVHLGLGAELSETFDTDQRITSHHLDLVLATGRLRGQCGILMEW
jgi:hypothetical protein